MTFYRKSPITVEAVQVRGLGDGSLEFSERHAWVNEALARHHTDTGSISEGAPGSFEVLTDDGVKVAVRNDWIIRDGAGRLDVLKSNEFPVIYEPVR